MEQSCSGYHVTKPGWVRVNFNYFYSEELANYVISAIDFVATHGWKFLPSYEVDIHSGNFVFLIKK